jgi:hypothetical protein
MLNMAEEVARIGRWRYYPGSAAQDWSQQMFRINGLDPNMGRDPGDIRVLPRYFRRPRRRCTFLIAFRRMRRSTASRRSSPA